MADEMSGSGPDSTEEQAKGAPEPKRADARAEADAGAAKAPAKPPAEAPAHKPAAAAKGEATAGAAAPADAKKKAAAKKALDKARKQVPEVREGRAVAGGVLAPKGKEFDREEIIARALEKIRATEQGAEATVAPGITRRDLFSKTAWAGFAAFSAFLGGCFGRFFFPRVLFEPPTKFKAGFPHEYAIGEVSSKYQKTNRVWIVRDAAGFYAVFARCTHLGCTPAWLEGEQKFKCPCHGSGYTKEAINYEGPAPRPMERCDIRLADDGQLLVDSNVRYLYQAAVRSWEDYDRTGGAFLPA